LGWQVEKNSGCYFFQSKLTGAGSRGKEGVTRMENDDNSAPNYFVFFLAREERLPVPTKA